MLVLINNDQHRNRFSDTKGNVVKLDRFASCIKTSPYTPCLSLTHTSITNSLKPYTPLSYISLEWVSMVTADRWWILWIPISSCSPSMEAGSKHSESLLQSTAPTTEVYWLIHSTDIQWSLGCPRVEKVTETVMNWWDKYHSCSRQWRIISLLYTTW